MSTIPKLIQVMYFLNIKKMQPLWFLFVYFYIWGLSLKKYSAGNYQTPPRPKALEHSQGILAYDTFIVTTECTQHQHMIALVADFLCLASYHWLPIEIENNQMKNMGSHNYFDFHNDGIWHCNKDLLCYLIIELKELISLKMLLKWSLIILGLDQASFSARCDIVRLWYRRSI